MLFLVYLFFDKQHNPEITGGIIYDTFAFGGNLSRRYQPGVAGRYARSRLANNANGIGRTTFLCRDCIYDHRGRHDCFQSAMRTIDT